MPRTRPTRRAVLAVAISPHTVFDVTMYEPTAPERRATGYVSWALGEMEPAQLEGPGWIGAPGGIWSTAGDIAKWDLALMRPGFLTPASREVMFTGRLLRDGTPTGYAGGLGVAAMGGRTVLQHGGATAGFSATNVFVPADRAAVVLLSNTDQNISAGALLRLVSPPRATAATASAPPRRIQSPMTPPTPRGPGAVAMATSVFNDSSSASRSAVALRWRAYGSPSATAR